MEFPFDSVDVLMSFSCWSHTHFFFGSLCSKAILMFEDDERFKAVERPREREDLFENYLVELHKKVIRYLTFCLVTPFTVVVLTVDL